jgi:BlaR1 peptidase M56
MSRSLTSHDTWRHSTLSGAARSSASLAESDHVRARARDPVVLPLAVLLAAGGAAASAAPIGAAVASVHRVATATGAVRLAGIVFSYPSVNGAAWALLGLSLVGGSAIGIALRAVVRQRRAYRGLLAEIEVIGQLSERPEVRVIADQHPHAFCAGYLRPSVYISRAAVALLGEAELAAVLAHEHHHRRVRDPLWLACGRILGQAFFFVPALRALFRLYAELAELNADRAAMRADDGGRAALASALLALEASGGGVSPERVDAVLGRHVVWRRPWLLLAVSLGSLSSLIILTLAAGRAASASATFNLPFLSSSPCLMLACVVLPLGVLAAGHFVRSIGISSARGKVSSSLGVYGM